MSCHGAGVMPFRGRAFLPDNIDKVSLLPRTPAIQVIDQATYRRQAPQLFPFTFLPGGQVSYVQFPADIPEIAITWKVIIMLGGNLSF